MSGRVVVMGLGRFGGGLAAARYFRAAGHEVLATDLRDETALEASVAAARALGVELRLGAHDPEDFDRAEILVVNPAIPFASPLVARARAAGARIVTEIGLTLRRLPGPVIGITGTNGKSTTASLAAAMLAGSGVSCALGGNIGRSLLNETLPSGTVAVLELSSFQLAWLEHDEWAPIAAVVTNLTGDHFDRHPDFAHYAAAKRRLVEAVPPAGVVILPENDAAMGPFAAAARGRVVRFGGGTTPPIDLSRMRLAGRHNRDNAWAAAIAALAAGATREGCERALADFEPLPHRLRTVREDAGVVFVDDSVSTTPEATAAAVDACGERVILVTGGRDKGLTWDPLLRAARRAKAVVAYGETGPALHDRLPSAHLRPDFDRAVRHARALAQPGDTVLLSPGFASYDEFPGFDARGRRFHEIVGESAL
ncbi:MAG: UDP-N-acetylmuramoyl-L-alanine--D-glutamate ligase [Planctomycetota bacterium]|nr:UDP-N-acetylmuramoyl-L-alanine--D-glutamate ligase [Planctomycetota bacterium]